MNRMVPCLALLAITGFGQISPVAKPASTTAKKTASAPKAAGGSSASDDAGIEKTIREKFAASKISRNKFEVRVQGGVATLTGKTDVLQHKGTATRLARSGGAARVVNHIEVSDAAKEKAASNLESGRRRAQVKRSEISSRK
jgi:osmotically-inducible protein OsmY